MENYQIIKDFDILKLMSPSIIIAVSENLKSYNLNLLSNLRHFELRLNHDNNVCALSFFYEDWCGYPIQIGYFRLGGNIFYPSNTFKVFSKPRDGVVEMNNLKETG